jgi:hypothetical protein
MNRRSFVGAHLSALILKYLGANHLLGQQQQANPGSPFDPGSPEQIQHWMDTWRTRGYEGPLILSRFVDPMYFLYSPIKWVPPQGNHDPVLAAFTVPKGFVTDLASIPRVFWSALKPDGNYAYSAILHDYMYWTQSRPRAAADAILRQSMIDFHVATATVATIYQAVRIGGQKAWDDNRGVKNSGESRILTQFPDDPTISWDTWKQDKRHFARPA